MTKLFDLTGRTAIVTGGGTGIGRQMAQGLAEAGANLVLCARKAERCEQAASELEQLGVRALGLGCDVRDPEQVRKVVEAAVAELGSVDVLVNNAGTVFDKRTLTEDGNEATFQVNHLSGFLLTELLLDRIVASAPARIVTTSSVGHFSGTMDFDDLGFERGYQIMRAYGRSKLANVLYTRELARRLEGTGVTATCLHPGAVATNIWSGAPWFARPVLALGKKLFMVSPATGGARLTYLAVSPNVEGSTGGYYERDKRKDPADLAANDEVGTRLVELSRELVGLTTAAP
jgi:retinol dehydrogenase 14